MKFEVVIKNNLSQIRTIPSLSGSIMSVLNKDLNTTYTATKMFKGWYYLDELSGWGECSDIKIKNIIEPFNPETDGYNPETIKGNTEDEKLQFDIEEIIDAINKSSSKINCTQVIYIEDNVEYPIYGMIKNVQQGLNNMTRVIEKVDRMPNMEKVDDTSVTEDTNLLAFIYNPKTKVYEWANISTTDLVNQPEQSELYTNEF